MRARFLALCLRLSPWSILAGACDAAAPVPPEESEVPCARIGDRCRLPGGPVGICNETTAPCDEPPCLACISQH